MKIALAQFNPTVGDFSGNSARILELARQAKQSGADLAVFSELCVCGYLPLDLLERPGRGKATREREAVSYKLRSAPQYRGHDTRTPSPVHDSDNPQRISGVSSC